MSGFQIEKEPVTRVSVVFPNLLNGTISLSPEARLEEAVRLAEAVNLCVCHQEIVNLREIKPGAYFGEGYIKKLADIFKENNLDLLIVDTSLSPVQQRNLETKLHAKVIDRTALILEIFGERARTREGKLQVELAHLTYQRSRLVRSWTHLERQRGGAGFLGGPGEKQIELDRRIIDEKIIRIKKDLEKVRQTRQLQRNARRKIPYPVVALVGYTNAGKSTLFNKLSAAGVFAQDLLFATLDPTMRRIKLPSRREVILSDTVGFISDLPHELIMSFRATLEEVLAADVIVHVRDIANSDTLAQRKDVLSVLENLGLKNIEHDKKYLEVLNKCDLLETGQLSYYRELSARHPENIVVSATTGQGIDQFLQAVDRILSLSGKKITVKLPAAEGGLLSWLHRNAEVEHSRLDGSSMIIDCLINEDKLSRLNNLLKDTSGKIL